MRKPELAAAIAEKADLTKEKAAEVLNFGTFEVRNRAERQGKNPQTGAPITIAAAKVPAFKPGKGLKEIVQ